MIDSSKRTKLVGDFIKSKRVALGLSQRALGQLFDPVVTTQFISNVERGVTPLPPIHVPVLAKALKISDSEIMVLLEKEYAMKLNGRLGKQGEGMEADAFLSPSGSIAVANSDFDFMKKLYDAYRSADAKTQNDFASICENILKVSKSGASIRD